MAVKEKQMNIHCFLLKRQLRKHWDRLLVGVLAFCLVCGGVWYCLRRTAPEELALRRQLVQTAEKYLGCSESDGSHEKIIDCYNSYEPSPRDYRVTYADNWCAAFVGAMALECGMDTIVPMECSCEQQINLFKALGRWQEYDGWLPKPGDCIYYVWDEWRTKTDCTAWADHVGIVVDTFGPVIKVIEGNKDDQVACRYIFLNDITIRGYGLPDYNSLLN